MKKVIEGWLARDRNGEIYLGTKKPELNCGTWVNFGESLQFANWEFPYVTFENSPQKISITIEDYEENHV